MPVWITLMPPATAAPLPSPTELFLLPPEYAWPLLILLAMMVGFAKSGIPGLGIVIVPLMAILFPANESVGILLPMLLLADIMAVAYYRRHAVWSHILRTLPWGGGGILIGFVTLLFWEPDDHQLKRFLGLVVLGVIVSHLLLERKRKRDGGELHLPQSHAFAAVIGIVGGFMTFVANAAGPVWMIYLLAMRLPKHGFMGTSAWLYLILNAVKIPFQYYRGVVWPESLILNAWLIPAIFAGGFLGILLVKAIPQKPFEWIIKGLTVAAAIRLLF